MRQCEVICRHGRQSQPLANGAMRACGWGEPAHRVQRLSGGRCRCVQRSHRPSFGCPSGLPPLMHVRTCGGGSFQTIPPELFWPRIG